MAAKKDVTVEFVKRYEDRDKSGSKVVIPAGTRMELSVAEAKKAGDKVRILPSESDAGEESGDEGSGD